jgi:prevent-host-death family protein
MKTIKASEFKARCLALMDEVAATHEAVVITKNGKPVAQLVPVARKPKSVFGFMKEEIEILGDIVGPLEDVWETER